MELGYESKTDSTLYRHFRYYLKTPLEDSIYVDESPFANIPIFRGSKLTEDSNFFMRMIGLQDEPFKEVGRFKGIVEVFEEDDKIKWEQKKKVMGKLAQDFSDVDD